MAMMAESVLSLLTAIMVIARAINILPNVVHQPVDVVPGTG